MGEATGPLIRLVVFVPEFKYWLGDGLVEGGLIVVESVEALRPVTARMVSLRAEISAEGRGTYG